LPLALSPDIYRAVLESLPSAVYLTDLNRQIAFWNTSAERITGYLAQEVIGRHCHDNLLMHCDENQVALCGNACPLAQTMLDGRPRDANIFLRHKEGQRVPVCVHTVPVRDEFGAIIGAAEYFDERGFQGIEARRRQARTDISLDDVTEIPDRLALEERMIAALKECTATASPFGFLWIAVDHIERLRHTDGCKAVNAVLYAVAQTLAAGTRPEDMVGRWSKDRFAALVACSDEEGLRHCGERMRRLVTVAGVPWWGDRISVTVSLGGAMARPNDSESSLVARAEGAFETAERIANSVVVV